MGGDVTVETIESRLKRMHESTLQVAKEMMEHPLMKSLLSNYPTLTAAHLLPDLSKVKQYINDDEHCKHCPGLEQCPNDFPGHFCKLELRTIREDKVEIVDRKAPCAKFLAHERQNQIRDRVRSYYLDLLLDYDEMDILSKDRQRASAVNQIFQYTESVKRSGLPSQGLYLEGGFGTGKTYLMGYLLHTLATFGYTGVIVYMPDFVEELKTLISDNLRLKETIDALKECDILIFDDIGAENLNPWIRDHILGSILNYRMDKKPTFYTSNFSPNSLQKHFAYTNKDGLEEAKAQRLMERILPYVEVVSVRGENQRGTK